MHNMLKIQAYIYQGNKAIQDKQNKTQYEYMELCCCFDWISQNKNLFQSCRLKQVLVWKGF